MPVIDKRDTINDLHVGGSDIGVQVLLSDAEAQEVYGSTANAGWYTFATLDGGSFGNEVDSERDKDEAGHFTGKIVKNSDEWFIENTLKESSDHVLRLLELLAGSPHRYRYALPAGRKEFDMDGAGTIETHDAHQLFGFYNGQVLPGFEFPTQAGEKRMTDVEIRGSKTESTPGFVFKTVYLGDDTTWQYVDGDDLSDFQDSATP